MTLGQLAIAIAFGLVIACYVLQARDTRRWKQTADNLASLYLRQRVINTRQAEDLARYKRLAVQPRVSDLLTNETTEEEYEHRGMLH